MTSNDNCRYNHNKPPIFSRHCHCILILLFFVLVNFTSNNNFSSAAATFTQRRLRLRSTESETEWNVSHRQNEEVSLSSEKDIRQRLKMAIVADLDRRSISKKENEPGWISYLITATMYVNYNRWDLNDEGANMTIEWEEDEPQVLRGGLTFSSRGQELSELVFFDGRLLTCDDRTGVVYRLLPVLVKTKTGNSVREYRQVPWVILADGDGNQTQAFKCEWATVKGGNLWIGSHGHKPNLAYTKEITPAGEVKHHDWSGNYEKMTNALGIKKPGYVVHEAASWSEFHKKWVFIPRKVNDQEFEETEDESKASNKILLADENFDHVEVNPMGAGELKPTHGVSSFKFIPIPETNSSYIVALKAEETRGGEHQASFILAFDLNGRVLLPETKIEDNKYEGLEFLP